VVINSGEQHFARSRPMSVDGAQKP